MDSNSQHLRHDISALPLESHFGVCLFCSKKNLLTSQFQQDYFKSFRQRSRSEWQSNKLDFLRQLISGPAFVEMETFLITETHESVGLGGTPPPGMNNVITCSATCWWLQRLTEEHTHRKRTSHSLSQTHAHTRTHSLSFCAVFFNLRFMYLNLFLTGKRMTPIAHIKLMKTQSEQEKEREREQKRKRKRDLNKATKIFFC